MSRNRAFTLVELLVVVAIIALLMSLLFPGLATAKKQAREAVCMSNLRQVTTGFIMYASEWSDFLPGSVNDVVGTNPTAPGARTFCWLGTWRDWWTDGSSSDANVTTTYNRVPSGGSIFRYVSDEKVYKCPEDLLERKRLHNNYIQRLKPRYSYTAPPVISGAPMAKLRGMRWAERFTTFNENVDFNRATGRSLPWLVVEEDENWYLGSVLDSAWSSLDQVSTRHRGKGAVSHLDGHVELRAYQVRPTPMTARMVYYELDNRRLMLAGTWDYVYNGQNRSVRFGYINHAQTYTP
ncbi:MAG: prepilin-type N-terminal cleavage/methylation domain-containing protein [Phycisphaerales bacterium]|nr:prepilin-type N-terminal cleavage/methylation domain-containing protein [Phycisphaerales bacterium]